MNANDLADLISAAASLLWPILGFVALFAFRKELANAIGRIRKGKFLGQEIELDEDLARLRNIANKASEEVALLPSTKSDESVSPVLDAEADPIAEIVAKAVQSPRVALILLATEVEREARQTLASIGKLPKTMKLTLSQTIDLLDSHYGLPKHVSSGLRLFWETRNSIIHGGETEERNILSAIDSGVMIFRTLQALPRETNWVHDPNVTLYSDPECKNEIYGSKGIMLRTTSPSGAQVFYRIFPSTRTHFQKGKRVAWEWSSDKVWNDTWYRDLETNEPTQAWSSAAEFIGRNLDDI